MTRAQTAFVFLILFIAALASSAIVISVERQGEEQNRRLINQNTKIISAVCARFLIDEKAIAARLPKQPPLKLGQKHCSAAMLKREAEAKL